MGRKGEPTNVSETLRTSRTDGIVMMHRGQIVSEWYTKGLAPDTPHLVFSVRKSITAWTSGVQYDLILRGFLEAVLLWRAAPDSDDHYVYAISLSGTMPFIR